MAMTCRFRRVCATRNGKTGLVPGKAEVGDVILIVLGGLRPLPFVARKTTSNAYKLIGTAYVHGIMDGETLESANWKVEDVRIQ